jgi:hypothetical protein
VRRKREQDLAGRDGRLMLLFAVSKFAGPRSSAGPGFPARAEADWLIAGLTTV